MEFVPLVVMLATIKKVVDFVRYAKAGDTNGIVTQLLAWLAGFGLAALVAHTPWAATINMGGVTLAEMNIAAQIFAGLALGSAAAFGTDILKAADNSQSAAVPALVGPTTRHSARSLN